MGSKLSFSVFLSVLLITALLAIIFLPFLNTFNVAIFSALKSEKSFVDFFFKNSNLVRASINSLQLAFFSLSGSAIIGIGLSYVFWRYEFPLKRLFYPILLVPLLLPPLISSFSFRLIFIETPAKMLGFEWSHLAYFGLVSAHLFSFYGYFFLFGSRALNHLDYSVIEAAMNLGSSKLKAYRQIILPQLKRPFLKSLVIVTLVSLSSFSAPLLLEPNKPFLTTLIYQSLPNTELSSLFALALFGISLIGVFIFLSLLPQQSITLESSPLRGVFPSKPLPVFKTIFLSIVFVFVLLPFITLIGHSFLVHGTKVSLGNFFELIPLAESFAPYAQSFKLALLATMPNLFFGLIVGFLIVFSQRGDQPWLTYLNLLPLGIPGIAIGLFFFMSSELYTDAPKLVAVSASMVLPAAYFTKHLPLMFQHVYRGLKSYKTLHVEAAINLGSSFPRVLGKIIIPLGLSSIATGFIFTFLFAFYEFPISLILSPATMPTVSVDIFLTIQQFPGLAALKSVVLLLFLWAIVWISRRIFKISLYTTGFDTI